MSRFEKFKTVSGREIHVRANHQKRHFTIKTSSGKYRTYQMSQEEFNSSLYHTGNDWNNFLKSDEYYPV